MSTATARLLPLMLLAPVLAMAAGGEVQTVIDPALQRTLTVDGRVEVTWNDPSGFSEIRQSGNRNKAIKGTWVKDLADYLATESTAALAPGQRLSVNLDDIDLAGDFEPWQGPNMHDVRMLRDIYPPKIVLSYTLHDADGQIIAQGGRTLSNLGYLQGLNTVRRNTDSLRYEKQMIDRWLEQELGPSAKLTAVR